MAIIREYRPRLEENGLTVMHSAGIYNTNSTRIKNTRQAADVIGETIGLNTAGSVIGMFKTSSGSVNACHFDVAGICRKALLLNAVSIILAHNHPGGSCLPSPEDMNATEAVQNACKIIGIHFLDHIIIPAFSSNYYSFREEGDI